MGVQQFLMFTLNTMLAWIPLSCQALMLTRTISREKSVPQICMCVMSVQHLCYVMSAFDAYPTTTSAHPKQQDWGVDCA